MANNNDMDDFVKDLEEDILDNDQLDDLIPEQPPQKKNIYNEPIQKPQRVQQPQQRRQPRVQQPPQQQYYQQPSQQQYYQQPSQPPAQPGALSSLNLDKLKTMISLDSLKLPLVVIVLFVILSLPQLNSMVCTYLPMLSTGEGDTFPILLIGVKAVVFGLIVLVLSKLI